MTTIKDIHLPFRDELLPASFRNAPFFCESNSRDNGRRIIVHEFPKKDLPYAEDMGRKAKTFSIRAFCITYPMTLDGDRGKPTASATGVATQHMAHSLETDELRTARFTDSIGERRRQPI